MADAKEVKKKETAAKAKDVPKKAAARKPAVGKPAPDETVAEVKAVPTVKAKPAVKAAAQAPLKGDGKQRIRIRLKAYDHKVIDQSAKQIVDTALRTGATIAGPVPLPTRRNMFTVVKSPHVYKKGREQFEMRIHKRLIDVLEPTPKTIDSLMNLSLPAGCDAEIKM